MCENRPSSLRIWLFSIDSKKMGGEEGAEKGEGEREKTEKREREIL